MDDKTKAALNKVGAVPEGTYFATAKAMKPYVDQGLVEGNAGITNPKNKGEIAFRLTAKGKADLAGANPTEEPGAFVIADVILPPISRLNAGPSKYPFDKLNPGQSFFIPAPADMKSPSKSFGSMVSAANKKYGNPAGDFRRFTTRSVMGDQWGQQGVKGVGVFRYSAEEEAKAKAEAAK